MNQKSSIDSGLAYDYLIAFFMKQLDNLTGPLNGWNRTGASMQRMRYKFQKLVPVFSLKPLYFFSGINIV